MERRSAWRGGASTATLLLAAGLALAPAAAQSQAIDRSGGTGGAGGAVPTSDAGGGGGGGFGAGGAGSVPGRAGANGAIDTGGDGFDNLGSGGGPSGMATGSWIIFAPSTGMTGGHSIFPTVGGGGGGTGFVFNAASGDSLQVGFTSVTGGQGGDNLTSGAGGGGTGLVAVRGLIVVNGVIAGGVGGASIADGGGGGGGAGVFLSSGGSFEVFASGTVRGGVGGSGVVGGAGGAGLLANTATIVNAGHLTGGVGGAGGGPGVGRGGLGGTGLEVWNTTATNAVGGVIAGGAGGDGSGLGGNGGSGVVLRAGGASKLTNHGIITAGAGGAGTGPLIGSGDGGDGLVAHGAAVVNASGGSILGGAGGSSATGFGGRGGSGVDGSGSSITNEAGASIVGGDGGSSAPGFGGGRGGLGVGFSQTGTLYNAGSIRGGNEGAGLPSLFADGVGVLVSAANNSRIINAGSIAGGLGADGVTRAAAVILLADGATLELRQGYSFTGAVIADGTGNILALGGADAASFDVSQLGAASSTAQYQGFNGFQKLGSSTWTLTGTSTVSEAWTVGAGTLAVNGSIASSLLVTVNAGGTLGGTGTIGNTLINAGGTLAPGNSIGTLTVQGNLTFAAGATYAVEVSPAGSDRVAVSGTATLGGATVAATYAPGAYVTKRYTILTAGGVSGSFSGPVNTNLPSNFTAALSQDATSVTLDLTLNYVPPGPNPPGPTPPNYGAGLTVNQANVAAALVNSFNSAGGIPLAFGALTAPGLSGASGEAATGIQQATVDVMDRFLTLMTDPYSNGRNTSATQMADLGRAPRGVIVAEPTRWSAWASGYGGVQALGGNATIGSHGTSTSIYGRAVGADYRVSPDTMIGFALGAAGTSYRLGQGLGGGSSDVFQIGLYGRHQMGPAYIAVALAYGWQDVTTERRFMGDRLTGRFTTQAFSGRIETGYRFALGFAGLTPYAAGQFVSYALPDYREQATSGSGLFALDYAGRSATAWRTELGLRADKAIQLGEAELVLRGRLAWAHNFNGDRFVGASFSSLPASSFIVHGASQAADMLLTSAGAELKWANGWSAAATFEGGFSTRGNSYAGRGTLRYRW